jgi:hypothetical protein
LLFYFLLLKFVPETIRSEKKVGFIFHPSLYVCTVESGIRVLFYPQDLRSGSWMKNIGIRIRDKASRIRNTVQNYMYDGFKFMLGTGPDP